MAGVKVLVAGWFSFPRMGATAGDLLTRDVVCGWLDEAGRSYDVALAPPFRGGVDWQTVDPNRYSDVVFVCGPFGNGWPIPDFLDRFAGRRLIGVNLSMLEPIETWNPFDLLLERDSSACVRPDLAMLTSAARVPVVGIVLVHDQKEYRNGLHDAANAAIERLVASRPMATVRIDTRLDTNADRAADRSRSGIAHRADGRRRDHAPAWAGAGAQERRAGGRDRSDCRGRQAAAAGQRAAVADLFHRGRPR